MIKLEVSQEDIDLAVKSCPNLCRDCVVGRALRRKFPNATFIAAYNRRVKVDDIYYVMDKVGQELVRAFNRARNSSENTIRPCTIILEHQLLESFI